MPRRGSGGQLTGHPVVGRRAGGYFETGLGAFAKGAKLPRRLELLGLEPLGLAQDDHPPTIPNADPLQAHFTLESRPPVQAHVSLEEAVR